MPPRLGGGRFDFTEDPYRMKVRVFCFSGVGCICPEECYFYYVGLFFLSRMVTGKGNADEAGKCISDLLYGGVDRKFVVRVCFFASCNAAVSAQWRDAGFRSGQFVAVLPAEWFVRFGFMAAGGLRRAGGCHSAVVR